MPIKGLTDQPRAFVELGQLRKGAPKPKDGKKPGPDLTYFRPVFNEGEEEAARMFFEAFGNEPKSIKVFLPFDDPDANFETWKEAYLAGGLVHRCNGETVIYAIDPDSGELLVQNGLSIETGEPVECDGGPVAHYTDQKGKKQPLYCKPEGRLKVIIPDLRRLAYMTVITHSIWDIAKLSSQLRGYQWENRGRLRGVPFTLQRRPEMVSTPSGPGNKRVRRKKWLLCIDPALSWVEEQFLMLEQAARPRLDDKLLELPPGVPDTNGHEEEPVEGEYEIQEGGQEWEHERPVYGLGLPDEVRNMNDFYRVAQERFDYPNKRAVVNVLTNTIGTTVLEAQKQGMTMPDLWGILEETAEPEQPPLFDGPDDLDEVPF